MVGNALSRCYIKGNSSTSLTGEQNATIYIINTRQLVIWYTQMSDVNKVGLYYFIEGGLFIFPCNQCMCKTISFKVIVIGG